MGILFDTIKKLESGMTEKEIFAEEKTIGMARVKADPKGKVWGKCDSCYSKTVLVKEVGLCGPCCFGESETHNGNF